MKNLKEFFEQADTNVVGEFLREITFVKNDPDDVGCYTTFDVVNHANEWYYDRKYSFWQQIWPEENNHFLRDDAARFGQGYDFRFSDFKIYFAWWWDGDGILAYQVEYFPTYYTIRSLINNDCKKPNRWENF